MLTNILLFALLTAFLVVLFKNWHKARVRRVFIIFVILSNFTAAGLFMFLGMSGILVMADAVSAATLNAMVGVLVLTFSLQIKSFQERNNQK